MNYREQRQRRGYGGTTRSAKWVQAKRSAWAKHIDTRLKAPKARTVDGSVKFLMDEYFC